MASEISLFSTKSFIEASKKFVCVKLGTYESKEHQDLIRSILDGRMENTAFAVFAPDGKTKLTRSGRHPKHAFGKNVLDGMEEIATKYKATNLDKPATLSDFNSFKQALNAASADQRLLVHTVGTKDQHTNTLNNLQAVFNDPAISGKFFYDIAGANDLNWADKIKNTSKEHGIFIIHPGTYGQTGTAVAELSLEATPEAIKKALIKANTQFALTEKRKVYKEHVASGREEGIDFKNTMPPGEDRDGDGVIDPKPKRGEGKTRAFKPQE